MLAQEFDELPPDQRTGENGPLIRSLLADRFKLKLSHTTKELPVYALLIAKNGPKFSGGISATVHVRGDTAAPGEIAFAGRRRRRDEPVSPRK